MACVNIFQMSKRKECVDCFNCSSVGRVCDRTPNRCTACLQTTAICRGYPRDLQWLIGVKSRGKEKGKLLSVDASKGEWHSTTPTNHDFIFKQGKPRKKRRQGFKKRSAESPRQTESPTSWAGIENGEWQRYGQSASEVEEEFFSIEARDATSQDPSDGLGSFLEDSDLALYTRFGADNNAISLVQLQPQFRWHDDEQTQSELSDEPQETNLGSKFLLPSLESSALLAWCKWTHYSPSGSP